MKQHTVLFVDDEASVLRSIYRLLRRQPLKILTAGNAAEALEMLAAETVHVVVSDQRMPGMSGTDFLKKVRHSYPHTIRCILSGYAEMHSVVAAINDGYVYRFIGKPWEDDELIGTIGECTKLFDAEARTRNEYEALQLRNSALEHNDVRNREAIRLQESLLEQSKDMLEELPVAIVAIDADRRIVYTNRLFDSSFGRLPGALPGLPAGEPWSQLVQGGSRAVASDARGHPAPDLAPRTESRSCVELTLSGLRHTANVSHVSIGGDSYSLVVLAVPAANQGVEP